MVDHDAEPISGVRPGSELPDAPVVTSVGDAVDAARREVPAPAQAPTVPAETEVAALHHAHEVLRSTLDRVERG